MNLLKRSKRVVKSEVVAESWARTGTDCCCAVAARRCNFLLTFEIALYLTLDHHLEFVKSVVMKNTKRARWETAVNGRLRGWWNVEIGKWIMRRSEEETWWVEAHILFFDVARHLCSFIFQVNCKLRHVK